MASWCAVSVNWINQHLFWIGHRTNSDQQREDEFDAVFGANTEVLPYRLRHADPPYLTSSGVAYSPHLCDMYDGVALSETQMVISGKPFPLDFEFCINVSEIEIVDNQVWIGTYQAGGHGDYGGVGLVVASLESGNELGRIDTGRYPINQVRIDPVDEKIWAITRDRIVVVEKNMEVSTEYVFYYDFDKPTKIPVVHIADEPTVSHPLAVFARSLPADRHGEFFEAVQTIPDEVARSFSLYDAYMCCHFLRKEDVSSEPQEFEILIPFLVSGFEMALPKYAYNGKPNSAYASRAWRQIACKHRSWNEEAERLCVTEDWAVLLEGDR